MSVETQAPDPQQEAFNRFVATHPNTEKEKGAWRKRRRSFREATRGPGGRHERSTRPGERLRAVGERLSSVGTKARKLGELGVGMALYGRDVMRSRRNYEQAQREKAALEAHQRRELEAGQRAEEVRAFYRGDEVPQAESPVRAAHRTDAPLYTAGTLETPRHAARQLEAAPTSVDGEPVQAPEQDAPHPRHAYADIDPLTSPIYDLRETVGNDADLLTFREALNAVGAPEKPADGSDLPALHDTEQAVARLPRQGAQTTAKQPGTAMRNHRTFVNTHR